ncbi:energy transducer TonB [Mucilaginibacter sp. HD30]
MRTLKNTLKIAAFVIAISFTASAQKPNPPVPKAPVLVKQDGKKVFVTVEKSPAFPGGQKALGTFLSKNIKYPAVDRENNVQGKVFVSFVVEEDGKLTDVAAVRGPSATLKAEAVRVIAKSPAWKPGYQNGKSVRVQFTVPVNFVLGGEEASLKTGARPKPQPPVVKNQKKGNIFVAVEKSPQFPGGVKAWSTYLEKNIKYPAADRENNQQGKVFISFVVEPDGKLTDVVAVRGPSETLKAEAVRVIEGSPTWKPGLQGGKPVRVQYTVPINFTLGS